MMPTAEAAPYPNVLHERARRLLQAGDAAAAHALLEQVVALVPRHLPFWLSLAAALRVLGRHEAELSALERALTLDPTHLVVLLQKGALLDLMYKPRSAATVYVRALQTLAPGTQLPAAVEAHLRHAEKRVRENAAVLGGRSTDVWVLCVGSSRTANKCGSTDAWISFLAGGVFICLSQHPCCSRT